MRRAWWGAGSKVIPGLAGRETLGCRGPAAGYRSSNSRCGQRPAPGRRVIMDDPRSRRTAAPVAEEWPVTVKPGRSSKATHGAWRQCGAQSAQRYTNRRTRVPNGASGASATRLQGALPRALRKVRPDLPGRSRRPWGCREAPASRRTPPAPWPGRHGACAARENPSTWMQTLPASSCRCRQSAQKLGRDTKRPAARCA